MKIKNDLDLPFSHLDITIDFISEIMLNNLILLSDTIGLFLCKEGHLDVSIDSKQYSISKNDMFIYTPSQYARIINMSDDFSGTIIQTDYDYVVPMLNKVTDIRTQLTIRENPTVRLNEEEYDKITQSIKILEQRIEREYRYENDKLKKNILRELIKSLGATLIYEIFAIYFSNLHIKPAKLDNGDILTQNFIVDLYHHYKEEREVSFYAQRQCFSTSHFSSVIKKKTGKSASQWIINKVLMDARQMLQHSTLSIKEISIRLNFPNQSFFGKYFKQYMGISPKDYRNNAK